MEEIDPERLKKVAKRQPLANLIIVVVSLLLLIPLTIVALRMYVRIYIAKRVRVDDFFMILATVFSIGMTIAIGAEAKLGVASSAGLQAGLVLHLLYFTAAWALKISVCCFCHTIFGRVISRGKNFLIWGSMAVVTAIYVISLGTFIFSCSPISNLWDLRKVIRGDGCINVKAELVALAVVNAIADWLIMYLPVALVKQSELNAREKKYLTFILSLAFLAVLASVGRVASYAIIAAGIHTSSATNWILLPITTSLEINIAIAASSLPTLSPLIRKTVERFVESRCSDRKDLVADKDFEFGEQYGFEKIFLDGKGGINGIMVETEYSVERSSPKFPIETHSPRRVGAGNARMEARQPVLQGRRLSFLDVLRQAPPTGEEKGGKERFGEVLGV